VIHDLIYDSIRFKCENIAQEINKTLLEINKIENGPGERKDRLVQFCHNLVPITFKGYSFISMQDNPLALSYKYRKVLLSKAKYEIKIRNKDDFIIELIKFASPNSF
jgi:hypothetical protein